MSDFRIWLREGCAALNGQFSYRFVPSYEEVRKEGRRQSRIALQVEGHNRNLVPDGVFSLEHQDNRKAHFLLEIDRGTEPLSGPHRSSVAGKFARYRDAFDSRAEEYYSALLGHNFNGFRILCVVPDNGRRDGFLKLAGRMDLQPLVWVATADALAGAGDLDLRCWFTRVDGEPHCLTE